MTWTRGLFLALFLALLPLGAKAADSQEGMTLNSYRVKAALPALCSQIGGTLVYEGHSKQCRTLAVSSGKAPTESASTTLHVAPVTTRK